MTLGNEPISSIMTENIHFVKSHQKIVDAIEIMVNHDIRHLIVKDETDNLAGIISKNDVDKFRPRHTPNEINKNILSSLSIEHMMTKNVRTVEPTDTIKYAAELISHCSYNALPVVDENEKLVGIITTTDLLRYLLRHC